MTLTCKGIRLALFAALLLGAGPATAQTVQGKLYQLDADGARRPAAFVTVAVKTTDLEPVAHPVQTDANGMYYFRNVRPGTYVLEIRRTENQKPLQYEIRVGRGKVTNIKPIVLSAPSVSVGVRVESGLL